ncbi:WG repeat-containing protein [Chryseobacterium nematophagum]|uniref:WG repeat-containing protein n=1 Tax=Chryseobacterium nematophagum TaxID=2305228 RepID=A0A3M7TJ31_9FLAO|nr:WG repeat-containing protein [Chryseobacterium nematophagum]RNA62669.1 WG repeat-containing protein [Chryseobacterium nematophagum]
MKNSFFFIVSLLLFSLDLKGQELINFSQDTLWGYKDKMNNIIIKPQYQYAKKFIENYAVVSKNDSVGIIDKKNNVIIPFKYNYLQYLGDDKFMFGYRTKYLGEYDMGIMDKNSTIIIPAQFYYIEKRNTFYKVTKNIDTILETGESGDLRSIKSLHGIYDINGREIISCDYDYIRELKEELFILQKDGLEALCNYKGKALTDFIYFSIGDYVEGLIGVRKENKCGFINQQGKVIIPVQYDYCENFEKGISIVTINNKFSVIDKMGKYIVKDVNTYEEIKEIIREK